MNPNPRRSIKELIPILGPYLIKRDGRTVRAIEINEDLFQGVSYLPVRRGSQLIRKTRGGYILKEERVGWFTRQWSQPVFLPKSLGVN